MRPFTPEEHARISEAIANAEKNTSGEIVVVVARASAGYRAFALMCAALIALAVPLPFIHFTKWPVEYIYLVQLIVFLVAAAVSQWEPLRIAIAPGVVKRARAHQRAVEQFLAQNLHTTKGRTGVLIYVSAAERYAEVIADEGIYRKVKPEVWNKVIATLTAHIGEGTRTEGFIDAIEICGKVLAQHFPPGVGDRDELPNHLIVLDVP
ncbi:MAG: TPM domain-containing protein [Methyloceanibacter sp.]|uniref:TPM domain-containing protein n=1 Tax=Methyloceanibacter sp. TaxID=1965321 RepID=UPI003D6CB02B